MAVYKTRWFDRWARKQGLASSSLCAAVHEMTNGLIDADLGGGLFKKRIGRPGQEKGAVSARWSPPTRAIAGSSCTASRRASAATSTGTKRKH